MNSGKPCSVRLTEGLGRTRAERTRLLSLLEAARLVAADVNWLLGETNPLHCTCIRLPFLNLLAGAAKRPSFCFGGVANRLPNLPPPAWTRLRWSHCSLQALVGYLAPAQISNLLTIELAERSTDRRADAALS